MTGFVCLEKVVCMTVLMGFRLSYDDLGVAHYGLVV